jgi:hypothetical protein
MENSLVSNVHELAYANFLSSNPTNITRILTRFYQVSMVVYRARNISYNASMMANTIITDFVSQHIRLFAREMCLEFVEYVMPLLYCSDGFWDFINRLNVHLFYLTYRGQIMEALSLMMASMHGSNFVNLVGQLRSIQNVDSPAIRGNSHLTCFFFKERIFYVSISVFLRSMNHFDVILACPRNNFSIFLVALARLWRENHGDADRNDERFQNAVKVYLKCLFSGMPFPSPKN